MGTHTKLIKGNAMMAKSNETLQYHDKTVIKACTSVGPYTVSVGTKTDLRYSSTLDKSATGMDYYVKRYHKL